MVATALNPPTPGKPVDDDSERIQYPTPDGRMLVPAGTLVVGDYITYAGRTVTRIDIDLDRQNLRLELGGLHDTQVRLWTITTPVIISQKP